MEIPTSSRTIADSFIMYVGEDSESLLLSCLKSSDVKIKVSSDPVTVYAQCMADVYAGNELPYAFIIRESRTSQEAYKLIGEMQKCPELKRIPKILYNPDNSIVNFKHARGVGADDFYTGSFSVQDMLERIIFLHWMKNKESKIYPASQELFKVKTSFPKRAFDIVFSAIALVLLLPFFLIIATLIKIESPGPVFYISKRVGTGYKIFDFYKFRSMRSDADKTLQDLIHLNQYQKGQDTSFIKIHNDPRITRIGQLLRNFSIDELPQLINVLKGDMSIVGNRPLPLYEAEKITKDFWSKRFLAPAGLTGLWQVSKRGKKDMSVEERIALDMTYADNASLWYDIKIVAQTFPAMIQKENV